ncbi:plasmid stabilization system protein ParE [Sphingomonas sp. BE123]|uniref:type II toxin-antitoxin system RelE/ParE family toxin n=1 Tax=Sphingomonas sp. BE123 TaxID=2817842 RepID=UPI00285CB29F|nr:type II toxin-antitoxin system RelE/ParE family toxin [Sphingomonas sp. BE123]MDR6852441.1 plasmid stabilization system protein ParE [Sphingomonas sp. BE123]
MAEIIWTRRALIRLDLIRGYVAQFDPDASRRLARRLVEAANSLAEFPDRGRPSTRGRRELVTVPPYVIRYKVEGNCVIIGDIKHGREHRD